MYKFQGGFYHTEGSVTYIDYEDSYYYVSTIKSWKKTKAWMKVLTGTEMSHILWSY